MLLVLAVIFSSLCISSAAAQGFMVKPMRIEVPAVAGRSVEVPLEIRNTGGGEVRDIELRLVELSQSTDGGWSLVEPASGGDTTATLSSLPWTHLAADRISIAPLQPASVMIRLDVPQDARGVYFAGVIAETPLPTDPNGVVVRIRFLIPIIVQITGRPVRQQVALKDADMTFTPGGDGVVEGTSGRLVITNQGRTFSKIKGRLTVEVLNADQWRTVTRIELGERSIIPGVTLELGRDLGRKMPAGHYRLRGELAVDGRRVPALSKEIDFVGDPTASGIAFDTALVIEPDEINIEIVPGATRTSTISVENPGDTAVQVSMMSATPAGLGGVELGSLRGIDLSAEPWTQAQPSTFVLRPRGRQNVRIISKVPREGVLFPNYYADLVLSGTYANGDSAGETHSTIHLANTKIESTPTANVDYVSLAATDTASVYAVQTRLTNVGNVHLDPNARVVLLTPQGVQVKSGPLEGDGGMLLPLGQRSYGTRLDLSDLQPGPYALRTIFALGAGREVVRQLIVEARQEEQTGSDGKPIQVTIVTFDPEQTEFSTPDDGAAAGTTEPSKPKT